MYIWSPKSSRLSRRGRSNRLRAKLRSKNRRRVNRMAGRRLSAKNSGR